MKQFLVAALALAMVGTLVACGGGGGGGGGLPLSVTSVTPNVGTRLGGTPITIKGANFTAATVITLADQPIPGLTFVNNTTMTGVTPAAPGGTNAGLLAKDSDNGLAFKLAAFYYIPQPVVTSVSPNFGAPEGLVPVTITGKGFTAFDAGPNTVTFGGEPATNIVTASDTTIKCTVPPAANPGPALVQVTNANGTGSKVGGYRYFPPPRILSVSPAEGTPLGGTSVTLTGSGFANNSPGPTSILFGGNAATGIAVIDDATIQCVTPAGSGTVSVSASNANGSGSLPAAFLYYPKPTLVSISPTEGTADGGVTVTITGTGFVVNSAGTDTVKIGGIVATNVSVVDDSTITCKTPATGGGPQDIEVSNNNGKATLNGAYTAQVSALLATDGLGKLYKVNPATAATTQIGTIGYNVIAMARHPDGTIYGLTTTDLIKIDLTQNGAGVHVTSLSQTMNQTTDITFKGSTLYAIDISGQSYSIDITTGSVTQKTTFGYNYYYGTHKGGFHYDTTNARFNYMGYDGDYVFFFDPEGSPYPSFNYGLTTHAVRCIGDFKGKIYGINCQPAGGPGTGPGPLSLVEFDMLFSSTTAKGSISAPMVALIGTE